MVVRVVHLARLSAAAAVVVVVVVETAVPVAVFFGSKQTLS